MTDDHNVSLLSVVCAGLLYCTVLYCVTCGPGQTCVWGGASAVGSTQPGDSTVQYSTVHSLGTVHYTVQYSTQPVTV